MKTVFRVLVAVLLAPMWLPIGVVFFIMTSPYWIIGFLTMCGGFVISGEWEWPDLG